MDIWVHLVEFLAHRSNAWSTCCKCKWSVIEKRNVRQKKWESLMFWLMPKKKNYASLPGRTHKPILFPEISIHSWERDVLHKIWKYCASHRFKTALRFIEGTMERPRCWSVALHTRKERYFTGMTVEVLKRRERGQVWLINGSCFLHPSASQSGLWGI